LVTAPLVRVYITPYLDEAQITSGTLACSNGFNRRNSARAEFDQRPIEAQTTVSACLEAYRAASDPWWYEQAQRAFDWFLGWNDLGLELYARQTGGCRDGLHAERSNENQGAESTLVVLLSLAEMRLIQNTANGVQRLIQNTGARARSIFALEQRLTAGCRPLPLLGDGVPEGFRPGKNGN
jgi:hypothetical protein